MAHRFLLAAGVGVLLVVFGCTQAAHLELQASTGGNAALFAQFQAYDGHTGRPLTFEDVAERCSTADVILFGEEHSDVVCNQLEAQLLADLATRSRPVALAMEFFEVDTQAALDDYLACHTDEPAFRKATRQGRAYVLAHRPLIELCRAACIPVLAANAPRRLVRDYRKSDLDYAVFRAALDPADQQYLPPNNDYLTGDYHARFIETMTQHEPAQPVAAPPASMPPPVPPPPPAMPPRPPETGGAPALPGGPRHIDQAGDEPQVLVAELLASATRLAEAAAEVSRVLEEYAALATQPATAPSQLPATDSMPQQPPDPEAFYRAQLLWDEAMAGSVAQERARCPERRVMLIVGAFHVVRDGGTAQKLRHRRPDDRIMTVAYSGSTDTALSFDAEDCGAGDIVIYGIQPPPEIKDKPPASVPVMPRQPS